MSLQRKVGVEFFGLSLTDFLGCPLWGGSQMAGPCHFIKKHHQS